MLTFLGQVAAAQDTAGASESMTDPSKWMNMVTENGPDLAIQVLTALAILLVGRFVAGAIRGGVKKVMTQRGVDPSMLGAPEVGLKAAGRPAYVRAVRGYAQGTPEGVAGMIRLVAAAVEFGAGQPAEWLDEV